MFTSYYLQIFYLGYINLQQPESKYVQNVIKNNTLKPLIVLIFEKKAREIFFAIFNETVSRVKILYY